LATGAGEARLLLSDLGFDSFTGENEWCEDSLSAALVVGRQAREAVTAVDQLFNGEEQAMILNQQIRAFFLPLRPMPTPSGN